MRLILTLFALLLTGTVSAAVPITLNYQGYLTDKSGAVIDGDTTMTFAIYNVPTGGSPLWSGGGTIPVDKGLFSVDLGGPGAPFPAGLFDTALWIGIIVAGDAEMTPRRALTTAAFAFEADNALSLQGHGPGAFDQSGHVGDVANPHSVTAAQAGAATSADIASIQSQLDTALSIIGQLQAEIANETIARIAADNAETAARIADVDAEEAARMAADGDQDAAITTIQANTVLALDGILTHPDSETALLTGVNLQVVNGTGTTDGAPNGKGNVIVGYNTIDVGDLSDSETCSNGNQLTQFHCESNGNVWAQSHKSGSHNVIVGDEHNYSRFGGIVTGLDNSITGDWSNVSGGTYNRASGIYSSVSGGGSNIAGAEGASVSAGLQNTAGEPGEPSGGAYSSISGGKDNETFGDRSTIVGGERNIIYYQDLIVIGSDVPCDDDQGVDGSYDICAGTMLGPELLASTMRFFSTISDSDITESNIYDSDMNAARFTITPSSSATGLTGAIYVDDTNALCVYLDDAWIKIAGTGTCE